MIAEFEQQFPFPKELVLKAKEIRTERITQFAEFQSEEVLKDEIVDGIRYRIRKFHISNSIPSFLRNLVPSHLQVLTEETNYDLSNDTNNFLFYVKELKDKIQVKGYSEFRQPKPDETVRFVRLVTTVDIPILGSLIASQLIAFLEKSVQKDRDMIMDILSSEAL